MTSDPLDIHHVVVPLDGSERAARAVATAGALAAGVGAEVTALGIVHDPADAGRAAAALEALVGDEVAVSTVVSADVVSGILGRLDDETLVCMATDGHGHGNHAVMGSTATGVVRRSIAPVVLVGPHTSPATPTRVVACLDGSPFAERALPAAEGLAHLLDVPLVLVEVVDESGAAVDVPESGYIDHQARALSGPVSWEVLHGSDAASSITAWVGDDPGTVIALASHGRSGLSQLVLGSVAAGVVAAATGPVLVVPAAD